MKPGRSQSNRVRRVVLGPVYRSFPAVVRCMGVWSLRTMAYKDRRHYEQLGHTPLDTD